MRATLIALVSLVFMLGLATCGQNDQTSEDPEREENTMKNIPAAQFPDEFLAGNYQTLYNQMSQAFQDQVSYEEFKGIGEEFNQDVNSYSLASEMPLAGLTEHQWLSDQGDKGVRAYFAEDDTIEGLQVMPVTSNLGSDDTYTKNTYQMPINEEWFTFWGGTNELVNYHYAVESQRYAYDLLIRKEGNSYDGNPQDNESYYAFGKEVVAPLEGVVVQTENAIEDNTPTVDTNENKPLGNHVIIEHENEEYSMFAHFQQGTVQVEEGQEVTAGELLGLAGNSGNSSEPHIHFHVADSPNWREAASIRIKLDGKEPVRGDTVTGF
ncbi:M23 family metallopeptidase [Lentibacillus sediminis]|uniref:M23 family metallopeptidase n=1 Tax=Lentibacillus sediminis TaxID=1940529 RepID=UPI001EFE3D90|nr:M23 family metallopeptidase [Lentibacillus sediminis]